MCVRVHIYNVSSFLQKNTKVSNGSLDCKEEKEGRGL